ncbi:methyltransferase [Streptomyces sp. AcH 505]|uniref:SAM-dependent methyltransferase n=1 Tax=unclassified Streptomyces TaxID=2593676 RepID=UPI000591E64F|nr:SAM-dependent methyltransferase [Streptomyces sp. NBC_00370]KIF66796.1 methyltransferase [Streptomyces sp. AcH 505]
MTGPKLQVDTSVSHAARVYDYLLGGKDHYPVDQAVGESLPAGAAEQAKQNRAFMQRAVRWLATQGVDQYLDIGTGIPTEPNLHQIVQQVNPASQVVYTDNDPIVLAHAEALLISHPDGATHYVHADVRQPQRVVDHARQLLDFSRPVALSMIGLLHFLPDEDDPYGIVSTLVAALAPGSYVALSQGASDLSPPEFTRKGTAGYRDGGIKLAPRTREEFSRFFDGLDVVEPGIVRAPQWFRDEPVAPVEDIYLYGAVGRVP